MANNVEWLMPFGFAGNKLTGYSFEILSSLILISCRIGKGVFVLSRQWKWLCIKGVCPTGMLPVVW